jgi:hypothetical protein
VEHELASVAIESEPRTDDIALGADAKAADDTPAIEGVVEEPPAAHLVILVQRECLVGHALAFEEAVAPPGIALRI